MAAKRREVEDAIRHAEDSRLGGMRIGMPKAIINSNTLRYLLHLIDQLERPDEPKTGSTVCRHLNEPFDCPLCRARINT